MKKIFLMVLLVLTGTAALAQQDTVRMKVSGASTQFKFTATKPAVYYVDWGDGAKERYFCVQGMPKQLKHTYASSNTYSVKFFCEKSGWNNYTETIADINFSMDMVAVEGGTFTMGCTSEQGSDCTPQERPTHIVTLSSYYISKYEITQAQWKAVMGTNPSYFTGNDLPVGNITWYQAKAFCDKLSEKTGKKYALPTEAQWEFAARGGVKSKGYKYSGSNTIGDVAWYYSNSSSKTHAVGTKAPNELGIYDMSGNVWEWCADWFGAYGSEAVTNPTGPTTGSYRVIRGGAYSTSTNVSMTDYYRVSSRRGLNANDSYISSYKDDLGFRVVCLP